MGILLHIDEECRLCNVFKALPGGRRRWWRVLRLRTFSMRFCRELGSEQFLEHGVLILRSKLKKVIDKFIAWACCMDV